MISMDLSKTYPRSVHEKFAGIVQIGRTVDKARASLTSTLGEYHFNCGMDQAVFKFLGVSDHEAFAKEVGKRDDAETERWIKDTYLASKSPAEIAKWNQDWVTTPPAAGSDSAKYFVQLRDTIAPTRTDVSTWPDLLDLDEQRVVPQRVAA
jgi:uncharacterized protein DUF5069